MAKNFDVSKFYEIFDNLDADLQFIFSHLSTATNFLDIYFKIVNNKLIMDLYCKPTDSHSYLNYTHTMAHERQYCAFTGKAHCEDCK